MQSCGVWISDRIEARHTPEDDSFCGAVTRNGSRERNLGAGSSQEMECWIDGITREELQNEQRCDPSYHP